MRLRVTPFYGWGWFTDDASIDVPPSFELSAEGQQHPFRAVGLLDDAGHRLDEMWVELTQRHTEWDGQCNLRAFSSDPRSNAEAKAAITGFVDVALLTSSLEKREIWFRRYRIGPFRTIWPVHWRGFALYAALPLAAFVGLALFALIGIPPAHDGEGLFLGVVIAMIPVAILAQLHTSDD